jgi:hypothetical protein
MQVKAVNRAAQRRYDNFKHAVALLVMVLEGETKRFITKVDDSKIPSDSYTVPTREEVEAARRKALASVGAMNRAAKKYEAELISRNWRV